MSMNQVLSLLDPVLERALCSLNLTDREFPRNKTIHQLFEAQVERTPDQVAIVFDQEMLTYRQLNARANRLARRCMKQGLTAKAIVGIMMDRSIDMVVSVLAVLKAGAAYVPIDRDYPAQRVMYILQDSCTKLVLTQRHLIDMVKATGYTHQVIAVDDPDDELTSDQNLNLSTSPHDLAYVIYTSGTTGNPKGTMLEHIGIVNVSSFFQERFGITESDRIGQFASISFDASVSEFFMALLTGASLYMIPKEIINHFHRFEQFMERNQITVITLPPTYVIHLDPERISSLRVLITAGSASSQAIVTKWKDKVTYVNAYGPTENSICTTTWIYNEKESGHPTVPIGKPIHNTKVFILNEQLEPVAVGETGELCISGVGLARGYWNQPDLTAAKFVRNPLLSSERMYRTGDIVRLLPDGNIEYLGRMDHQVKIRGHRIEMGEIERTLLNYPGLKEVVVIAREDSQGQSYLCCYYVSEEVITTAELRTYVAEKLPSYMIPSYFVKLDRMPLTPNDKIDRKALPDPIVHVETTEKCVAPRNPLEQMLVQVWQEILGIQRIGITDSFYTLGGDSIKAIQISARMLIHQLKLEAKDILQYSTIECIAPNVKTTTRTIDQGMVVGKVELSPIQRWFFERKFTNNHHWNQSYMLYRKEGFDERLLRKVLDKIVEHHDALRVVYREENSRIMQWNRGFEDGVYTLHSYDLSRENQIAQVIESETQYLQSSLNLQKGPLIRAAIFHTSQGDHLFLVIHHLLTDGISWRILFEDLAYGYAQALKQQEIVLPPKTDSFQLWSSRLQTYANDKNCLQEMDFWDRLGTIAQEIQVPKDYATIACKQSSIRHIKTLLSQDETLHLLKNAHHPYATEMNDLLLAALGLAIHSWSGLERIVIQLEGHGREDIMEDMNITRTIGWFTSQYPVLLDLRYSDDLSRHIKTTKEDLRKIPNKGIGYEILRYVTHPNRKTHMHFPRQPEINFNYLGQFDVDVNNDIFTRSPYIGGNTLGPDGVNNINAESESYMALNITGVIADGQLVTTFSYSKDQYHEDTILALSEAYRNHLKRVIYHCLDKREGERTPSDFSYNDLTLEELDDLYEFLESSVAAKG
ncbi:MAG TPA: amino acid adenylation domain-containing protein [Candidatus Bathyarchaeia archaeon]|nr:amino acid adenylation domain-containing protein [Candidatus Bathyarchaeia archaeon]